MPVEEPPISRLIPLATGLRYHVLEWGADDAALEHTVILLHGFLDNAWAFRPLVDAGLAGRFHLVAPDMRGHGDSDRVGAGGYYYFADYLADLHELIAAVGRARVSLVGHSMGGNIASYYAGTFPARIARLVLLEAVMAAPHKGDGGPERVAAWIDGWRRVRGRTQHSYATVEDAAARLVERDPRLSLALALEHAERGTVVGGDGLRRYKHDPLHLTSGPYGFRVEIARSFWAKVACPTLIVEAGESEMGGAGEGVIRPEIAGARHALVEDAGHMLLRHQPRRVAELVGEFLAE